MKSINKKPNVLGIVVSLSLILIISNSFAYDHVVTGKGNAEYDLKVVKEAVDQGGKLLLKGSFTFGPKGSVNISNDIEIYGELNDEGMPVTKINGGFWTFHTTLPSTDSPLPGPGPKVKIKNIHFDGATWTPMYFPYTSGAKISGNIITNVQPHALPVKWSGGEELLVNAGALMGTRFAHREKIIPGAVTGNLVFNNNKVNLGCEKPELTMGQGAFFIWTWGATIEIKGNKIRNVSRNSIETLDNYLDEEGRGSVLIADNNIVTPSVGIPFPSPTTPNGIIVGWFLDRTGGGDPAKNSKITVLRNYVQTNGETSVGIASLSDSTAILGNRVEVKGGKQSKGIAQLGCNAFIARNQIDGTGGWALRALSWKGIEANRNTFAWNDVSGFKASASDFQCVGNNNTFIGRSCNFDNKGMANIMLTQY